MDIRPCFFLSKRLKFHSTSSVWDTKVIWNPLHRVWKHSGIEVTFKETVS